MKAKIPPSLSSAIEAHERAQNALKAHHAETARLEQACRDAHSRMRTEQVAFDAMRPQCRLVHVGRLGSEIWRGDMVIERRTPRGALVVRAVGDATGKTTLFRWHKGLQRFENGSLVLRDVPSEWLPVPLASASAPS